MKCGLKSQISVLQKDIQFSSKTWTDVKIESESSSLRCWNKQMFGN